MHCKVLKFTGTKGSEFVERVKRGYDHLVAASSTDDQHRVLFVYLSTHGGLRNKTGEPFFYAKAVNDTFDLSSLEAAVSFPLASVSGSSPHLYSLVQVVFVIDACHAEPPPKKGLAAMFSSREPHVSFFFGASSKSSAWFGKGIGGFFSRAFAKWVNSPSITANISRERLQEVAEATLSKFATECAQVDLASIEKQMDDVKKAAESAQKAHPALKPFVDATVALLSTLYHDAIFCREDGVLKPQVSLGDEMGCVGLRRLTLTNDQAGDTITGIGKSARCQRCHGNDTAAPGRA